jgi:hypothetical protein
VYLTAKPKDHKCLYADIKGLRRAGMLDKIEMEKTANPGMAAMPEMAGMVVQSGFSIIPMKFLFI